MEQKAPGNWPTSKELGPQRHRLGRLPVAVGDVEGAAIDEPQLARLDTLDLIGSFRLRLEHVIGPEKVCMPCSETGAIS